MPVTSSYGTRRCRSKDGWQQVAGPVVWAVSDKERLPSARQERFVVRQAAAPPTTASEAMAGTRALPHGTRQRLGAASARPLSLPASVDWAVRAVSCRCVGRAVCAAGLGPWAPGECRHALRAQQPAQAVCERAGHSPAGTDSGLDTRFVSRPGFPSALSRSPAVQPGCLGAQTPAIARDRDPGPSCAAGGTDEPSWPSQQSLLQHPKGGIWVACSSRISKATQEISSCLLFFLLLSCSPYAPALARPPRLWEERPDCWWRFLLWFTSHSTFVLSVCSCFP